MEKHEIKQNPTPFVKWAGGKRQIIDELKKRLPDKFTNYYEPFLGGGAVFFEIKPNTSILNDSNKALMNAYEIIKINPDSLVKKIRKYDRKIEKEGKEYFYELRERFNYKLANNRYDIECAALFIFINKHCFNGLYRVNSNGGFNVPFNNNLKPSINEENIYQISEILNENVILLCDDFEKAVKNAREGDFVFFDSPYAPIKNTSFEAYTKEGFSQEDHIRLCNLFKELDKKGCFLMLTNHNTEFIRELYADFNIDAISVRRAINSDATNRVGEEVIITNYKYQE